MKGFAFLVLIALCTLLLACGGGEEEGELFFQAGEGEIHVSGANTLDGKLTQVTGLGALYRPKEPPTQLFIPLQSTDRRVKLGVELLQFRGPSKYTNLNTLDLTLGEATYNYGIYNKECTVTIDTASDKSVAGSLNCQAIGNCVPAPGAPRDVTGTCREGFRLETVGVTATFRLESPKRLPLPKPIPATPTPVR